MSENNAEPVVIPTRDDDEAPPEGFSQASGDIVGYWEPASPGKDPKGKNNNDPKFWYREEYGFRGGSPPILFTPIDVVLSDSKLEAKKTSTLLFGRLERECLLRSAVDDEGYKKFAKGSLIGVWTKPGMRPLQNLAGAIVWMRNGVKINDNIVLFKDVDKPSPMVQFDIRNEKLGGKLPVREDRRKESLPDTERAERDQRASKAAAARAAAEAPLSDDNIPF
jgi:hypothetical protein